MATHHITRLLLLFMLTLGFSCQHEQNPTAQTADSATAMEMAADTTAIFYRYFTGTTREAVLELKRAFEQGLRKGMEKRTVGYAYNQHATRMKLDFFNNESFEYFYPYNGAFTLSDHQEQCEQVPFFTDRCGFQYGEDAEVLNYWCLSLEENFFDYLAELGKSNALIETFRENYETNKTISPDDRRMILIESQEALVLDHFDHQLFYFLFHAWVNEEYQATKKLQTLTQDN